MTGPTRTVPHRAATRPRHEPTDEQPALFDRPGARALALVADGVWTIEHYERWAAAYLRGEAGPPPPIGKRNKATPLTPEDSPALKAAATRERNRLEAMTPEGRRRHYDRLRWARRKAETNEQRRKSPGAPEQTPPLAFVSSRLGI